MRTVLALAALTASSPAHATTVSLSAQTTDSSQAILSGTTDPDTTFIWIQIAKSGGTDPAQNMFATLQANAFSQILYLKSGPGDYQITVYESKSADKTATAYYKNSTFTLTNTDPIDRVYLFPSTVVQSDDPSIIALAKATTAGINDDLAKSKALHDWVATHVSYNVAAVESGVLGDQSALATLHSLTAVCSGYARLSAALQRAVGIPVRLVAGTASSFGNSGSHEWDEVSIAGQWITEDPTWDAGGTEDGVFIFRFTEQYFNPDPTVFAEDHTRLNIAVGE